MNDITSNIRADRRHALLGLMAATAGATIATTSTASAARSSSSHADSTGKLAVLTSQLARSPRRRDFRTVPMVLDDPDMWDAQALDLVIAYRGEHRQVWDNTEIDSPWLNLMRNSLNAQVFSFRHPDFLAASATHGSAHLALYDQTMWDKYQLAKLAGPAFASNTLIKAPDGALDASAHEDPKGLFGAAGNTIPILQKRGVVFMACHNAIWEQTGKLIEKGINPDHLSHEQMAAELTNHLIDGVVLTPGIVATIPELQHAGFGYVK
ncbi:thiosulfate dehydrogenase [Komagataeibacter europaeus]|uniref:thiosulfate dehydrogenase n=1 Tax=Komagataeibacter europaeus TaxID=33995 RepID=UPI0003105D27|nr:transcriptional initiation protein Tat [Komagataeibacter europaeus]